VVSGFSRTRSAPAVPGEPVRTLDAIHLALDAARWYHVYVPLDTTKSSGRQVSGRFLLRVSPEIHALLQQAARAAGLSLNEYCLRRLATPGSGLSLGEGAAVLVRRAAAVAGSALVGVIVYGSWIRGEATPDSDVDALIVVDATLPLNRELYRLWDAAPVAWGAAAVDPHFVHLPGDRPRGLWGEAAIDGAVLFERGVALSRCLARVRRDIADGRLVRRVVHGQPYWTVAA
jgi:predicted nucleotidyltransferase